MAAARLSVVYPAEENDDAEEGREVTNGRPNAESNSDAAAFPKNDIRDTLEEQNQDSSTVVQEVSSPRSFRSALFVS